MAREHEVEAAAGDECKLVELRETRRGGFRPILVFRS
jgi:hypothetical protein